MNVEPVKISEVIAAVATIALVATPACWWVFSTVDALTEAHLRSVIPVYTSVSVTMLGFTLAMLAILVSVSSTRLVRNINKTGHYDLVVFRLLVSAGFFGAVLVSALTCLFLFGKAFVIGAAASSGLMIAACYALTISSYKFWIVLKLLHADKSGALD